MRERLYMIQKHAANALFKENMFDESNNIDGEI